MKFDRIHLNCEIVNRGARIQGGLTISSFKAYNAVWTWTRYLRNTLIQISRIR